MTDGGTSVTEVYDALGRVVEHQVGTSYYQQVVYGPGGNKVAQVSGGTLLLGYVPLPGGGQAVYDSSGLKYYRRPDYLGSSRLASKPNRTLYFSGAYAPYGEDYAAAGTRDVSFTGQDQMVLWGIYDFMYRRYDAVKGRWISPDPAGRAAVDPSNPQTWNRYGYVGGNPVNATDPTGLMSSQLGCGPYGVFCQGGSGGYHGYGWQEYDHGIKYPDGVTYGREYSCSAGNDYCGRPGGGGPDGSNESGFIIEGGGWGSLPLGQSSVNLPIGPSTAGSIIDGILTGNWGGVFPAIPGLSTPIFDATPDTPLSPDAIQILSGVYKRGHYINNPCFWGAWTVEAAAAGAGGAAVASRTEIATAAVENYPGWFNRAVGWLFRKVYNPGPVGAAGAGIRASWKQINSTCSQL